MTKRYYWLRLKDDFFRQLPIKKLRRVAGGDTFTIIYLKMMLLTTKTDGVIGYDGATDDEFIENLALDIDEDMDNVKITCNFIMSLGLMEKLEGGNMLLPEAKAATGSEQASAQRVRDFRAREKAKALQCNTDVTSVKQNGNVEIEIEKENRDKDKEKDREIDREQSFSPAAYFEYTVGITITPFLAEQILALYEETGRHAFEKACQKAAKLNKRSIGYIQATARGIASGNDFDDKPKEEKPTVSDEDLDVYKKIQAQIEAKKVK